MTENPAEELASSPKEAIRVKHRDENKINNDKPLDMHLC